MENVKVIQERENPLFSRKEIILEIKKETIPNQKEIKAVVSEKYSSSPDKIKIRKIKTKFGSKSFTVDVFVYNSANEKTDIELKKKRDEVTSRPMEKPVETKVEVNGGKTEQNG
ncbi:hypothetical protein J4407_01500 [Candidatus Pacearchaeota archaeon]|nr:hypothetical protein [Candidatus Pacearchaeota archaeon]